MEKRRLGRQRDCCSRKPRDAWCHQKWEAARRTLPESRRRARSPADTLAPDSGLQDCVETNFYCFKPLSLR